MMIVTWRHGGGPKIPIAIENKFVEKERKKTNFIDVQENWRQYYCFVHFEKL